MRTTTATTPPASLPPIEDAETMVQEPAPESLLRHDPRTATLLLLFAPEPYPIDLAAVRTKADLLGWLLHLREKTWMDTARLHAVATTIARIKGWHLYASAHHLTSPRS